jgi:hypothetical protein
MSADAVNVAMLEERMRDLEGENLEFKSGRLRTVISTSWLVTALRWQMKAADV